MMGDSEANKGLQIPASCFLAQQPWQSYFTFISISFSIYQMEKVQVPQGHEDLKQSVGQFSCSVMSDPLQPHGLQHARLPCPSPTPRAYSNSCPSSW